ncbi:MAG: helix-turn-helix transcriptional regulator, partial [Chloroflexota bacterium]
ELRTGRGMTQAALASPDFSKGFISLLETGRTRISLRAAHIFANRLGVEVTDLLAAPTTDRQDIEFMLLRAEQELRAGQHKVAAEIAATWMKKSTGVLRARFQRLQARAMIETHTTSETVKVLDEALRAFRALGARDFVARTLFDLARAHGTMMAPGEAVNYALQAEHAVERGDVIDRSLELDIHQLLASMYHWLGDKASASIRAERARALAEDVADPAAVARLYQSLSLTRFEEGDKEAALAYARKAVDLFETVGLRGAVAGTWVTLGWLFTQREQYGKASEALDRADQLAGELDLPRVKGHVTLNRGAIALARGDAAKARELAEAAADADGPRLRSRAMLLRAKAIAAGDAPVSQVRKAFEEALLAHKDENAREQARAHQAYADSLSTRNQDKDAYAQARKALELIGPKI